MQWTTRQFPGSTLFLSHLFRKMSAVRPARTKLVCLDAKYGNNKLRQHGEVSHLIAGPCIKGNVMSRRVRQVGTKHL